MAKIEVKCPQCGRVEVMNESAQGAYKSCCSCGYIFGTPVDPTNVVESPVVDTFDLTLESEIPKVAMVLNVIGYAFLVLGIIGSFILAMPSAEVSMSYRIYGQSAPFNFTLLFAGVLISLIQWGILVGFKEIIVYQYKNFKESRRIRELLEKK